MFFTYSWSFALLNPTLNILIGRVVRKRSLFHQTLKVLIGIILITFFSEMLLIIQIKIENNRWRIGKTKEEAIPS